MSQANPIGTALLVALVVSACVPDKKGPPVITTDPGLDATIGPNPVDMAAGNCGSLDEVRNCGSCGNDCTKLKHVVTAGCVNRACVALKCAPGKAHCSGNPGDGCESDLTTAQHCGSCENSCPTGGAICDLTSLEPTCACKDGDHACGNTCVANDIKSCGPSCEVCSPPASHGSVSCNGLGCVSSCDVGYHFDGSACVLIPGVRSVAAGSYHTCIVNDSGAVQCWGLNGSGQLGNGTLTTSKTPVAVTGLSSNVTAISAGGSETCALLNTGGVKCWGIIGGNTPTDISGLTSGVAVIAVGAYHVCAVLSTGAAKCWGDNTFAQLGNGLSGTSTMIPVDVSGLSSGVSTIAAGTYHTCALLHSGGIKCWGGNSYGEIGNGTNASSKTPVDVSGLTAGAAAVSAGSYLTCALTTAGTAKCWGYGVAGALGNGVSSSSQTPVNVSGISTAVSLSAQGSHACAVLSSGALKCWGYNTYGELGNNMTSSSNVPVDVTGLSSSVAAAATGNYHSCGLLTDGKLKCWGYNQYGALGTGTTTDSHIPVDVAF